MTRAAAFGLLLVLSFLTLAPAASAEPDLVREARGCATAVLYGGEYQGNLLQCGGGGVLDSGLVDDVRGCVGVLVNGGEYWGTYLQCGRP